MIKDWKWLLAFVVTVLSVFVAVLPVKEYFFDGKDFAVWQLSEVRFQNKLNDWLDTEVKVGGKAIASPTLFTIEVKNEGSKRIDKGDWEEGRPLTISFGGNSPIEKYRISAQTPSNLHPQIKLVDGSLHVAPLLLNKADHFQLEILVSGDKPKLLVDARISDIAKPQIGIKQNAPNQMRHFVNSFFLACGLCIFVFGFPWLYILLAFSYRYETVDEYILSFTHAPFMASILGGALSLLVGVRLYDDQMADGFPAWLTILGLISFFSGVWVATKKVGELRAKNS